MYDGSNETNIHKVQRARSDQNQHMCVIMTCQRLIVSTFPLILGLLTPKALCLMWYTIIHYDERPGAT